MDTPERNQINATLSKFEDSPVYNYINSLSPIKPVKSVPISQTFNSLSFSSPPSVFTSPHVSCLKESRFLRRHHQLGTSKPKVSSDDVNKVHSSEETFADSTCSHHNSRELQENTEKGISVGDASIDLIKFSVEHIKFSVELPQTLKYDCGSPSYDPRFCGDEANSLLEFPGEAASDVGYVQEGCRTNSVEGEVHLQEICQMESKSEGPECLWDNLIPDAPDMLIFNTPGETEAFKGLMHKQLDSSVRLSNFTSVLPLSTIKNGRKMHSVDSIASGSEHEIENHCSEPITAADTDQRQDSLANVTLVPNEKANDQFISVKNRAIRRRCLDFEMANVQRKNTDDNSNTGSSTSESDERNVANEKQLLPKKRNGNLQRGILPGIGLHLNALAALKDYKGIQIEKLSSRRQLSLPSSTSLQISTSQEHQHLALVPVSSERELDPSENGVQPAEDCSLLSAYMAGEDFNQNSPRKKRRKLETPGETEGCKRCNCKKSKCLKLYCECFAAGVYCIEPCSCQDCFNKPVHEDTVLQTRKQIESRNPLAFAPKVIRSSEPVPEIGDDPNKTPASARHKRGCNCKKSNCLKKYCECYQGGVGCSISCRCEGCKNAFGRKDGSAPVETEPEETEASDKGEAEKSLQKTEIPNMEDHPDSATESTPLRLSRPLLPLPFSSKGKPPRSFVTTISGSTLFSSQKLVKSNSLWSQAKHFQSVPDDEMPDILRDDSSPITCIKTSSPNGKRISSPNCDLGSSPSRRGGRKLILQSIPSFPSLTPHP